MYRVAIMVSQLNGGGAEKVAADLSIMLSQNSKYEVYLFLDTFSPKESYGYKGKKVISKRRKLVKGGSRVKQWVNAIWRAQEYRRLKKEYDIDCTISFMQPYNLLNILSRRMGEKVILTVHTTSSKRKDLFHNIAYHPSVYPLYRWAHQIIAVSEYCRKDLIYNCGVNANKVSVIFNPLNLTEIQKKQKECSVDMSEDFLLSVGRLEDVKQQWHMIRAFSKVIKVRPDAKLFLVGKGVNEKYLRKLVRDYKMEENVLFWGQQKNPYQFMGHSKAIIVTSASEAFPVSVIEAFACGIPVIAGDCPGGIHELMTQERVGRVTQNKKVDRGIITPRLDGKKYSAKDELTQAELLLADAMIEMLINEAFVASCKEKCYALAQKLDMSFIGECWEQILS